MEFSSVVFKSTIVELSICCDIMKSIGFTYASGWDYSRITFDYKFDVEEGIFYLRIPAHAIEGDIGSGNALLEILTPYIGKHYYPHGIEYSEDEEFPQRIIGRCEKLLKKVTNSLTIISI